MDKVLQQKEQDVHLETFQKKKSKIKHTQINCNTIPTTGVPQLKAWKMHAQYLGGHSLQSIYLPNLKKKSRNIPYWKNNTKVGIVLGVG